MLRSIGKQSAESVETRYKPEVVERDRSSTHAVMHSPTYACTDGRTTSKHNAFGTASQTVNSRQPSLCGLRLHTSGIHCQLTSLWQTHCLPSVDCF